MNDESLNPYYTGSYSMSGFDAKGQPTMEGVLILIILEVTL